MNKASDELRQQRVALLRSGRAADELLIEAIFGDVLFGRLSRSEEGRTLDASDAVLAATAHPALSKAL